MTEPDESADDCRPVWEDTHTHTDSERGRERCLVYIWSYRSSPWAIICVCVRERDDRTSKHTLVQVSRVRAHDGARGERR